jgi:lysophospholipase L1-like esterase
VVDPDLPGGLLVAGGAGDRGGAVKARLLGLAANVVLLFVSAATVLLGLEGALRVRRFVPERQVAARRMVDGRWTTLLDCYPSNPRGYFDVDLRRPQSRARYFRVAPHRYDAIAMRHPWAVVSECNHLRFRDVVPADKREGVKRVVMFGDSFTEGQGVKEDDTVARVLQRRLDATAPGRYEVRNCGRRGLDFPELFDAFRTSLQYEPDLVVYALVLNDADRPPEFQARQSYVNDWILDRENPADDVPPAHRLRLVDFVSDRVSAWRVGRATTRWYLDMWSDANPGWATTREHILEMDVEMRRRGGRLLVAPWPLLVALEGDYPFRPAHEAIRRFCLEQRIPYHDLLPAFLGRRTSDLWVHPVDRHPNEVAHRLAAESLLPEVLRLAGR